MQWFITKKIIKLKQELFLYPETCDALIWNHMFGSQTQNLTKQDVKNYLVPNNIKSKQKTIDLLIYEFSTKKLTYLTREQFILIFIDQRRKGIYEVMEMRKRKFSFANNHTPHFKIIQMIKEIFIKTLDFLEAKQQMKQNIFDVRKEPDFKLQNVDTKHFLIFINKFQPLWGLEQCDVVLNHIFKLKKRQLKQFYFFFVPYQCKSKKLNPDRKILEKIEALEVKETYLTLIDHKKASHFGKKEMKLKKTLYLK